MSAPGAHLSKYSIGRFEIRCIGGKRNAAVSLEKSLKRKLKLEVIANVKEKKRALETAIKSLETDIEEYSIAAEK